MADNTNLNNESNVKELLEAVKASGGNLKFGSVIPKAMKFGNNSVDKIMYGSNEIWNSVTDLTGTTWQFTGELLSANLTSGEYTFYLDWVASINDTEIYTTDTSTRKNKFTIFVNSHYSPPRVMEFSFPEYTSSDTCRALMYDGSPTYWGYIEEPAQRYVKLGKDAVLTITFSGGQDATNTDFITWVKANATQIS